MGKYNREVEFIAKYETANVEECLDNSFISKLIKGFTPIYRKPYTTNSNVISYEDQIYEVMGKYYLVEKKYCFDSAKYISISQLDTPIITTIKQYVFSIDGTCKYVFTL